MSWIIWFSIHQPQVFGFKHFGFRFNICLWYQVRSAWHRGVCVVVVVCVWGG
jgi:hypothetical protein